MSIKISNKTLIITIIIVLVGIFLLGGYVAHRRAESRYKTLISALNDTITTYKYKYGESEKTASEIRQIVVNTNEAYKSALIEKEEAKKLHFKALAEVTSLKAQVKILKDSIAHTGSVIIVEPCDSVGLGYPVIKLPFAFKEINNNYSLSGGFSEVGNMNIDLTVPVSLDIWTGLDKATKQYKAVVTSTNSVVQITQIRSVKIDVPKPFYDKLWFRATTLGVAFIGGMIVAK
jgi:hypothetical protein